MKSKRLNYPIFYLKKSDINKKGEISNPSIPKNVPIIVMIQSSNCGWCIKAKPEYQKFANKFGYYIKNGNYRNLYEKYEKNNIDNIAFVTTIQPDIDDGFDEKTIKKIDNNFKGFPHFMVMKDGKKYTYEGKRTTNGIKKFISNL